jgi:hypothetical protein
LRSCAFVPVAAIALALGCAPPAVAGIGFAPTASFSAPEGFGSLRGVAVDNTAGPASGDVYTSDFTENAVARFSASGAWEKIKTSVEFPFQVAVDQNSGPLAGDVYVAGFGASVVYRFNPALKLEEEIQGLENPEGVAVNAAGDVFVSELGGSVLEFNSAGQPIDASGNPSTSNTIVKGLTIPRALAIAANGDLLVGTIEGTYAYTLSEGVYKRIEPALDPSASAGIALTAGGNILTDIQSEFLDYEATGALAGRGGAGTLVEGFGIAVNTLDNRVYVADSEAKVVDIFEEGQAPAAPTTEGAQPVGPGRFVLHGTLEGGAEGYYFAYNVGLDCKGGMQTPLQKGVSGPVEAEVSGLEAATQYSYCLVATGRFGFTVGPARTFSTGSAPPSITNGRLSAIYEHSATASATLNPENLAGSYHVECATESLSVAAPTTSTRSVAYAATAPFTVSAQVTELQSNSEYHCRYVATNAAGETSSGEELVFRTLAEPATQSPDRRVLEMVTPAANHDANVYYPLAVGGLPLNEGIFTELPFEVSNTGNAVAYLAAPTAGGAGKGGTGLGNQYLAQREAPNKWVQSNIQPPGRFVTYYRGFSEDLATGVVMSGGEPEPRQPPLAPETPGDGYSMLYACHESNGPCIASLHEVANPYKPLLGHPLLRPASAFATSENGHRVHITSVGQAAGPVFAAGSDNFTHILFEANDALPEIEEPFGPQLDQDVLAEVEKEENSDYLYDSEANGRLRVVDVLPDGTVAGNATFGGPAAGEFEQPDFTRVISSDGRRVFWTDLNNGIVYARIDNAATVQVSAGAARYWTASSDGRFVFYTEAGRLYRFDLEGAPGAQRTALSEAGVGVLGVIGASADGRSVYFAATDDLTAVASGEHTLPRAGEPNLYLSRDAATPVFISTLAPDDAHGVRPFVDALNVEQHGDGDWAPGAGNRTAEVSGDGSSVAFMSERSLPVVGYPGGYPNDGDEEVYLYSAAANELTCVSCGSTGAPPVGAADGAAAFLPVGWIPSYLPQWVNETGTRVFFDSVAPLTAQATNGHINVYEWERLGEGSCTSAAAVNGGCIYLLSGGASESSSWLLGTSSSGDDVFFVTREQLAAADQNEMFDLYDAHAGGERPPETEACTGSGCQGAPAPPPAFAIPPSITFAGSGNFAQHRPAKQNRRQIAKQRLKRALRACAKQRGRRRKACVQRARRRYGGGPAHKTSSSAGS